MHSAGSHHLFKLPLTSSGDPLKGRVKKSLPRSLAITTAGALQKKLHRYQDQIIQYFLVSYLSNSARDKLNRNYHSAVCKIKGLVS